MKKILGCFFFCCSLFSVAQPIDGTEKERLRQEERLEQERLQQFWQETEENTRKKGVETLPKKQEEALERTFYISNIRLEDPERILDSLETNRILEKYQGKDMGSVALTNLLVELTNRLIAKGYVTSSVGIAEDNDLTTGVLQLKILYGRVEEIVLNDNNIGDRLQTFFLLKTQKGDLLNLRDLDTATENFNSLSSHRMTTEILPGSKAQHSVLRIKNETKKKGTLSFTSNNHGEDKQNVIWRYGSTVNMDSPFGIGDRLYLSYQSVHRKTPDRSWKETADTLEPGEILPIGPPGYDPSKGSLPYKRILDMVHVKYTMKFRDYTLNLGSSQTKKESSFYAFHTVYDGKSKDQTLSANLERILWRNQKSKLVFGVGIKRKHHENYLEKAVLSDRILSMGDVSLEGSTVLWKGIASVRFGYERGLRAMGAERDSGKRSTTPKAQFHKYTFHTNYYKPVTEKLDYRFRLTSSYSKDVLYGSEKQSIGGVGSVGGFHRTGTIQGDKAIEIENELSYKLWNSPKWGALSPYVSHAYGVVRNNKNPSKYGKGHMAGMTLGLRYQGKYLDFDVAYAKSLQHSSYLKPKKQEVYVSISTKIPL